MPRPALCLKPKVGDFRRVIDLAWLRRTGARVPGYNGHITWSYQGNVKASVAYTVERAGLRLRYKRNNQAESISEFIPISTTATKFGGRRHWFSCPGCKRRCRMVYGAERFLCRLCLGAEYESKYQDVAMTIAARRWRIRQRLEEKMVPAGTCRWTTASRRSQLKCTGKHIGVCRLWTGSLNADGPTGSRPGCNAPIHG